VFGSARTNVGDLVFERTARLSSLLGSKGMVTVTGGGPGQMLAANAGAGERNSYAIGINLPNEQGLNKIMAKSSRAVMCNYFFPRKLFFIRGCEAVVVTNGGLGTFDELFEVLTLIQTGRMQKVPVVLFEPENGQFFKPFIEFIDHLIKYGYVSREDADLFVHFKDENKAAKYLAKELLDKDND